MSAPGWYPDPTGRFAQRWHDGHDFTASVVGANGQVIADHVDIPAPAGELATQSYDAVANATPGAVPPPPPGAGASPAWSSASTQATSASTGSPLRGHDDAAATPSWTVTGAPPRSSGATAGSTTSGPVLAVVAAGVLAIVAWVVNMFVLDWVEEVGFGDIRDNAGTTDGFVDGLVKANFQWLAWAWAAATLIAVGAVALTSQAQRRSAWITATALAAIGAAMSTVVVGWFVRQGADLELPAWLLPAGYVVVLAGLVAGAASRR